jgi:hypothetical protein
MFDPSLHVRSRRAQRGAVALQARSFNCERPSPIGDPRAAAHASASHATFPNALTFRKGGWASEPRIYSRGATLDGSGRRVDSAISELSRLATGALRASGSGLNHSLYLHYQKPPPCKLGFRLLFAGCLVAHNGQIANKEKSVLEQHAVMI